MSTTTVKYTDDTRFAFGGDFRARLALTLPDGTLSRERPMNKRSLIPSEPGAIINRKDPTLEFGLSGVEISQRSSAATQVLRMLDNGWKFCSWDEWDLGPRFREIWAKAADGKIVTNAGGGFALALMWCPRKLIEDREAAHRQWSREIEQNMENKLADSKDRFDVSTGQKGSDKAIREAIARMTDPDEPPGL